MDLDCHHPFVVFPNTHRFYRLGWMQSESLVAFHSFQILLMTVNMTLFHWRSCVEPTICYFRQHIYDDTKSSAIPIRKRFIALKSFDVFFLFQKYLLAQNAEKYKHSQLHIYYSLGLEQRGENNLIIKATGESNDGYNPEFCSVNKRYPNANTASDFPCCTYKFFSVICSKLILFQVSWPATKKSNLELFQNIWKIIYILLGMPTGCK